jgi:hypothetical protein
MLSFLKVNIKNKNKKKKKKINIFRVIKFLLLLIIGGMVYSLGVAVSENIRVDRAIEAFKERSVFEEEVNFEYASGVFQVRRYYSVSRETSYELQDTRSVFYDSTRKYLGQKGDIYVTQKSPFPDSPAFHLFMSYYFGGHAAINNGENKFIEATGFPEDDETVWGIITQPGNEPNDYSVTASLTSSNYWLNPRYRPESAPEVPYFGRGYRKDFIGLRVKNVTQDQLDGVVEFGMGKVDVSLYNFLFFLDMEYKFYCTDLVSRAWQHVLIDEEDQRQYSKSLNDDGFITSVNDIILSDDTYMTVYVEVIDEVYYIYYLEDI